MKQLAPGVFVIDRYEPETLDPDIVGQELLAITKRHNMIEYSEGAWDGATWKSHPRGAELRAPKVTKQVMENKLSTAWHHDGRGQTPNQVMIVWSNREQTEVKTPGGEIVCPEPYDVIAIVNDLVEHRTPRLYQMTVGSFGGRARCQSGWRSQSERPISSSSALRGRSK